MQRISQLQLGLLLILYHFSTAAGFLMGSLASRASYQGWLVILLAVAGGMAITYICLLLAKQRPDELIVQYGKELVGRWLHYPIMIGVCFFFIHLGGMVLRESTDFIIQIYLPTTPTWMIAGLFGFVVSIGVRSGIEAIFRCASGFFFVIFGTAGIVPLLVGKELNYHRAVAFLTHLDIRTLFGTTYSFIPWFGEMFLVLFIFPFISQNQKTFRTLLWSTLISLCLIEINFILCLLLFGAHFSGEMTYPVLEMVRFIRIGDFLENLDPLVVAIWISSLFIKMSLLLYIAVLIVSQLAGLKDVRPLAFSMGAIMVALSVNVVKNTTELNQFLLGSWPNFALFMECSPVIYWVVWIVKKRRHKAKSA